MTVINQPITLRASETADILPDQGLPSREITAIFGGWDNSLWKLVTACLRLLKLREPFATCFCLILQVSRILDLQELL